MNTAAFTAYREKVVSNCARVIVGKEDATEKILVSFLCGGHVLLEDKPGTGKTMLLRAFARTVGGGFKRVQFTPDLLPSDITGVTIYDQRTGSWDFHKGPIFASIVLADEINRASPKTQSALLEVMEEAQVTVDGVRRETGRPFMVIATQNPVDACHMPDVLEMPYRPPLLGADEPDTGRKHTVFASYQANDVQMSSSGKSVGVTVYTSPISWIIAKTSKCYPKDMTKWWNQMELELPAELGELPEGTEVSWCRYMVRKDGAEPVSEENFYQDEPTLDEVILKDRNRLVVLDYGGGMNLTDMKEAVDVFYQGQTE